ncbi:CAP domain-containing protein [Luedemannella helvata]|uniref:SCP domain-containing protein n=1 Tax=Luedemannella helvata TaxID=349315 RepID=A0ABP4WTR8_9ACTN
MMICRFRVWSGTRSVAAVAAGVVAGLAAGAVLGAAPGLAGPSAVEAREGWYDPYEESVLELTNYVRRAYGCENWLRRNNALESAATYHSREMATSRSMSHRGYDRSDPDDRIYWAGYNPSNGWAENIAYGYGSPYSVVRAWMDSPGHRRNILNCRFRSLGVGVARAPDGTLYWTQNFGGR